MHDGSLTARAMSLLASLLVSGCSESTGPFVAPETIEVYQLVEGELGAGEFARYSVSTSFGTIYWVYLQGHSGSASDSLVLSVSTAGVTLGSVVSSGLEPDLVSRSVRIPAHASSRELTIDVKGLRPADAGRFRFSVRRTGSDPEVNVPAITFGDTVRERIDTWLDEDRFLLRALPGDEFNVLMSLEDSPLARTMGIYVHDPAGQLFWQTGHDMTSSDMERAATHFSASQAGLYQIFVRGVFDTPASPDIPYRMVVHRLDPSPESWPALLTYGDTAFEAFDVAGDRDTFSFDATAGDTVIVALSLASSLANDLGFQLRSAEGVPVNPSIPRIDHTRIAMPNLDDMVDRFVMPTTGRYVAELIGPLEGPRDGVIVSYRLEVRRVISAPEARPATAALDESVFTERLDRGGDLDMFRVPVAAGEYVNVTMAAADDGPDRHVRFLVLLPGEPDAHEALLGGTNSVDSAVTETVRIAWDGDISVRVTGHGRTPEPYRFTVHRVDAAPEHVPIALPLNTWVDEEIDVVGDVDSLTFMARAGQRYNAFLESTANGGLLSLGVTRLSFPMSTTGGGATGVFVAERDGQLGIKVASQPNEFAAGDGRGAYRLRVFEIDTAPESTPATYVVGDTVSSESIFPAGDSDQFSFSAPPGTKVRVHFTDENDSGPFESFRMLICHQAWGFCVLRFSDGEDGLDLLLDQIGTYSLRVEPIFGTDPVRHAGAYAFALVVVP